MIRPTRRSAFLFAGLLPVPWLLLTCWPWLWPVSFVFSGVLLVAMALDIIRCRPLRHIDFEMHAPEAAYIGESIEAAITVRAPSAPHTTYEVALDVSGDAQPYLTASPFFVNDAAGRKLVRISTRRRGWMHIERAWVRWRGPFGLMGQTRQFPVDQKTAVLPDVDFSRGAPLAMSSRDALLGNKVQWGKGEGAEFEAMREYQPGLDPRFIDWKHSARHRKLVAREFRIERNHPIVLAFDTGYLMREPLNGIPRLDHSISAGLRLAHVALDGGDLVGAYSFDSRLRQFLPPARGIQTMRRLQIAAAALAYNPDETNFTLGMAELQTRLQRRSLIVLFTDFIDTITAELLVENIRRLAGRHLLIFVTLADALLPSVLEVYPRDGRQIARAVLAGDFLRERSVVLEKLERLGIHCIEAPPGQLTTALLNRYLLIKQRGLL